jgi:hypothetical protein
MHRTLRVISESGIDRGDDHCFELQIIFQWQYLQKLSVTDEGRKLMYHGRIN